MSDSLVVLNIIILLGWIIYAVRYKRIVKSTKYHNQKKDAQIGNYQENDLITSYSDGTDRSCESYCDQTWRFTMPYAAVELLIECCEGDEKKVYQIKRAIELSMEHLSQELANDTKFARNIQESVNEST